MMRLAVMLALAAVVGCTKAPTAPAKQDLPPMPPSGYRVEWGTPGVPCTMKAGSRHAVSVIVKNVGDQKWHTFSETATGKGAIRLSTRWFTEKESTTPVMEFFERGDLPAPLAPGGTATMTVTVKAPASPGLYRLQLDLVQELIDWFQNKGAPRLIVYVAIT